MEILAVDTSFCKMIMGIYMVRNTPTTDPLYITTSNSGTYYSSQSFTLLVLEHFRSRGDSAVEYLST